MQRKDIEKPEIANPIHIDVMLISLKKGLIKPVDSPAIITAEIIVTRGSTHLGITIGVKIFPIAYVSG